MGQFVDDHIIELYVMININLKFIFEQNKIGVCVIRIAQYAHMTENMSKNKCGVDLRSRCDHSGPRTPFFLQYFLFWTIIGLFECEKVPFLFWKTEIKLGLLSFYENSDFIFLIIRPYFSTFWVFRPFGIGPLWIRSFKFRPSVTCSIKKLFNFKIKILF